MAFGALDLGEFFQIKEALNMGLTCVVLGCFYNFKVMKVKIIKDHGTVG